MPKKGHTEEEIVAVLRKGEPATGAVRGRFECREGRATVADRKEKRLDLVP
jgi:hypothetical protein